MRHFKQCDIPEALHQVDWFDRHGRCSPRNAVVEAGGYSYDHVDGECPLLPERVPQLIEFCEHELWGSRILIARQFDYHTYVKYLWQVLMSLPANTLCRFEFFGQKLTLTPVNDCHGDLTLENVVRVADYIPHLGIEDGGRFVFIDPGHPRGLPCRELDEAKIMQSLEEWFPQHGTTMQSDQEEWLQKKLKSPAHNVLLASHYLRLLRHAKKHPEWRVEHAKQRLAELTGV